MNINNFDLLDWFGQITLWRMGECCNNYFVVPYQYENRNGDQKFGVKIFAPNGLEGDGGDGFESIEEAIEFGRSCALEDFEEILQVQQTDQLYPSASQVIVCGDDAT